MRPMRIDCSPNFSVPDALSVSMWSEEAGSSSPAAQPVGSAAWLWSGFPHHGLQMLCPWSQGHPKSSWPKVRFL